MKPATEPPPVLSPAVDAPTPTYAEQLARLEAQRRASDDLLLRKMLHVREPMNPG
ncbi:hypothetical protein [Phenylobacterium sp.]|uniref:hypothetical protein n=1 Tax=Phenylobacterium sp. TaxID=1871053 RepID=UPI002633692C|nr:hypothetical protein [Phenylobacterium sp.]